jgi:hypothetical protein
LSTSIKYIQLNALTKQCCYEITQLTEKQSNKKRNITKNYQSKSDLIEWTIKTYFGSNIAKKEWSVKRKSLIEWTYQTKGRNWKWYAITYIGIEKNWRKVEKCGMQFKRNNIENEQSKIGNRWV